MTDTSGDSSPGSYIERVEVRVRVLPGNRLDRKNAAKYLHRAEKTLAMWAVKKKGPPVHRDGTGRCWYFLHELDAFAAGAAA